MFGNCQIFTPKKITIKMLALAGYDNNLYGKKILENSCGDGNILELIIENYIIDCQLRGYHNDKISKGLSDDIYAYEIDIEHYLNCISRINNLCLEYGITNVKWSIYNKDFLKETKKTKYDFIIGNPPYINYTDLNISTREYIKSQFQSCSNGKPDYCYAFIEKSIQRLSKNGTLVYLVPISIFKNVFGQHLRDIMLKGTNLIQDYSNIPLFENILTSSAIIRYSNILISNSIDYFEIETDTEKIINKSTLKKKWIFSNNNTYQNRSTDLMRFGDLFKVNSTIATLCNDVYVLKNYTEDDNYIYTKKSKIEKSVTRFAYTSRTINKINPDRIIFPYYYNENMLCNYHEEEFSEKFPYAYDYLTNNKQTLDKTAKDIKVQWFEYGRTQALCFLNMEKLFISSLISKNFKAHLLTQNEIPYSGIMITTKTEHTLDVAQRIINNPDFIKYVKDIGISAHANSMRINVSDLNNYIFDLNKNA